MVIPGELSVTLKHIGMKDNGMVLSIMTTNQRGEKVLDGGAEVTQPTTVCVCWPRFSGHHCMLPIFPFIMFISYSEFSCNLRN
jgi:hypothetical protein